MYFENKRRSGGGMVEEMEFMTANLARVKFESSEGKFHHFKERGGRDKKVFKPNER